MSDLYQKGNHPDGVRAICKECDSVTLKDTEKKAREVADSHNEQQHDGEEVAGVCAWDVQSLPEMLPDDPSPEMLMRLSDTLADLSPDEMRAHIEHRKAREEVGEA